jgi:hypothetical protein
MFPSPTTNLDRDAACLLAMRALAAPTTDQALASTSTALRPASRCWYRECTYRRQERGGKRGFPALVFDSQEQLLGVADQISFLADRSHGSKTMRTCQGLTGWMERHDPLLSCSRISATAAAIANVVCRRTARGRESISLAAARSGAACATERVGPHACSRAPRFPKVRDAAM